MFTTLYNLLQNERIEIPIIQRDYAQGRENKVYLRERLLGSLITALKDEKMLSLDFVYGTKEHGVMWPLDGQQRLTTLWLLHWYLSVRTGNLENAKDWLSHFTYETRTSSRDFCESMCSIDSKNFIESKMLIVDYIKDQTWYFSKYNQDPTIQGMLRTLGGTNITNADNVDIPDGIEEFLLQDTDCQLYWERLTSEDCPIRFLFKDMKDDNLPLSDDLYIKMNARGKQLTDFENFKADLIGYAPNPDRPSDKLLDVKTASLLDNEWTDIFWNEASGKNIFKVDDIYFKFMRRYFLDRFIALSGLKVDAIKSAPLYQALYNGTKKYDGLRDYREVLTAETIDQLKLLFSRWNGTKIYPHWDGQTNFAFIPEYIIKETDANGTPLQVEVSSISQKERAIFHAVVCYFESNAVFNDQKFSEWIRFAWNIVENSALETEDAMIGAIHLFEELRSYSGSIISFLASEKSITSDYGTRQMKEERYKAKLISGIDGYIWEPLIREGENMPFFKGNIACLLRHDKNEFVSDIDCFKLKLSKAKQYFDNKGVKPEYALPLTQALIKVLHRWDQLQWQSLYDTSSDSWKQKILNSIEPDYFKEVHSLLTANSLNDLSYVSIDDGEKEWTKSANRIKEIFSLTDFLETPTYYGSIINPGSKWRLYWAYGVQAFYPYRKNYAYNFDWIDHESNYSFRRNEFLHHPNMIVDTQLNPECQGIYWNWRVYFEYNGKSYYWDNGNKVYLLNRQNNPKRRDANHKNDRGDEFFCIHMNELIDISQQSFLIRLSNLAKEAD